MDIGVSIRFDETKGNELSGLKYRATAIECLGFSTIWYPDHIVTFERYSPEFPYPYSASGRPAGDPFQPWYDCQIVLAALASVTSNIRLGSGVVVLPQRNPLIVAKEAVTLDHLSLGRLNVGIGIGWSGDEFNALGVPIERRGARTNEYLDVMKRLWSGTVVDYDGEFVQFRGAIMQPPTYQRPHPPIFIGGESLLALRRAAQYGDGWISGVVGLDRVASSLACLHNECEAVDRDPSEVRQVFQSVYRDPKSLEREMAEAELLGIDEMVLILRSALHPDRDCDGLLAEIAQTAGLS